MAKSSSNSKTNISAYEAAIAGGTAGAITRAIAQPLDVIKIRFQLQLEPISNGSKYSSILQATSSILKEEGLVALWSGHIPAQYLSISYGIIQFAVFEKLITISRNTDLKTFSNYKHSINFVSGAVAATTATILSFPFDTVRTRLIAERKTEKAYTGFTNAFITMVRKEGTLSLFKGLLPTIGQIAPHAGIQFLIYKLFTHDVFNKVQYFNRQKDASKPVELTMLANLIAGSIAGFVSKAAVYPFDVLKKRLQIQGFQQYRTSFGRQIYCTGMLNCVHLTIKEEGFLALYKGFGPSILKAVLVSALHFAIYDEIKHIFLKS